MFFDQTGIKKRNYSVDTRSIHANLGDVAPAVADETISYDQETVNRRYMNVVSEDFTGLDRYRGDFKVLRYNDIDDRQTTGTINRRNDEAVNSGTLAGSGGIGNGFSSSLYANDGLAGEEQGSRLQLNGPGEGIEQNRRNARSRPLTGKEYRALANRQLIKNGKGRPRFSFDLKARIPV